MELVRADGRRLLGRMLHDGRLVGPGDRSAARGRAIDGTLGDVVAGRRPGRMHDDDVVVFNPFGMAILDVAVAAAVVDVAVARGVGRALRR